MFEEPPENTQQRWLRRDQILVVEDDPDQWALIEVAGNQTVPDIEFVWVKTTTDALAHLTACQSLGKPLPKLMLLDLYVPDAELAWALLRTVREPGSPFFWLPVVLISNSHHKGTINDFYSFGGTSYIVKPGTYEQWVSYLQALRQYWWNTVTLPNRQ